MFSQKLLKFLFLVIFSLNINADELKSFEVLDSNATKNDENSMKLEKPKDAIKVPEIKQFIFENDFIAGTDEHYTNGIYYSWLNNENIYIPQVLDFGSKKRSKSITLTHLMFTPEDLASKEKIDTDIPYSGYIGIDYKTFQYDTNHFHELGASIGFTGRHTYAKEFQTKLHLATGNTVPQGWDNQLSSHLIAGISYQYGVKTDKLDLKYFHLDLTGSAKFTLGELYTGSRIGWVVRAGNKLRDNFFTTGDFLGGLESSMLNFKKQKGFYWILAYGGFVNNINHFYIMEASDDYKVETIKNVSGDFFAYTLGYNSFSITFHMKTNYLNSFEKDNLNEQATYGGLIVTWEF